jgi:uncharacterized membrane protein required for colicin V production
MKSQWLDLIVAVGFIAAAARGYRAGFVVSILSAIGFIGGGVGALLIILKVVNNWHGILGKFGLIIAAIFMGASLGEWIMRKFGAFFHKKILFGPFRWVDSLLGAAFSLLRTVVITYLVAAILLATPWSWAHQAIPGSHIYQEMKKLAPSVITKVTEQVKKFA